MTRRFLVGVLAALAITSGAQAQTHQTGVVGGPSAGFKPCKGSGRFVLCGTVAVPLDAKGVEPGQVDLHVEELPAPLVAGQKLKVAFLIAGGPGQASAVTFNLARQGEFWQSLLPGYVIVTYDDRGTGGSSRINCARPGKKPSVLQCGENLGAARSFYGTRENASDMDAVRRALGVDTVTLFGVSYGTKQALAYAAAYPSHIDRIVLDSVVALDNRDPFDTASLRAIPHGIDQLCVAACKQVTSTAGRDFVTLANQLQATPVNDVVKRPGAAPIHVRLNGVTLLDLGFETDLDAGLAAELPAAVGAGLAGDFGPLERIVAMFQGQSEGSAAEFSDTVYLATNCADGPVPWKRTSPVIRRLRLLEQAIAALPPGATGRLGTWSTAAGVAQTCAAWPSGPAPRPLKVSPLPNVPVLILSGSRDIRTPTAVARQVAALFPRSRVMVVGNSGHDVTSGSLCADEYVAAWLRGKRHAGCPPIPLELAPVGAFANPDTPKVANLTARQTLAVAMNTLREAEATFSVGGSRTKLFGIAAGTIRPISGDGVRLTAYSDDAGVTLNGVIEFSSSAPGGWLGDVKVSGARAVHGSLFDKHHRLTGSLKIR